MKKQLANMSFVNIFYGKLLCSTLPHWKLACFHETACPSILTLKTVQTIFPLKYVLEYVLDEVYWVSHYSSGSGKWRKRKLLDVFSYYFSDFIWVRKHLNHVWACFKH